MKAKNIQTGNTFEITGTCNLRHEDGSLWLAVSYLDGEETKTTEFPINEETGEVLHPDYEIIYD